MTSGADAGAHEALNGGSHFQPPELISERSCTPRTGVFLMVNTLETGGSERQFIALARSLDASRYRVRSGCIRKTGAWQGEVEDATQFSLGGSLYGLESWRARARLGRHLRRHEISVAHAFDFYTNLTLIPAARLARVPVVIGSHRQLGDLLKPGQSRAQLAAFHWCDKVVCNSQAAARALLENGLPRHKVAVIPNGLGPEFFTEVGPALPRPAGLVRIGMIARMNAEYKNHSGFLRAAARLYTKYPAAQFVLVGDGPLRSGLEREAERLGLRDRVQFLGDRPDIPTILASLDISVLPSGSESLSNVILESMAAGVPVVATSVGGTVELLADGRGMLVPVADDEALATAIERILRDDRLHTALSDKARQHAREHFTIEQMRARHEDLYDELLAHKRRQAKTRRSFQVGRVGHKKVRVALVAPTLRWVGGQSVQADLLCRYWQNDAEVEVQFIPVDPEFPRGLRWAGRVPFLRTLVREPIYLLSLWRGMKDGDIAHIFSASYWSFLLAPAPAWLAARLRGKKTLINYRSGEARNHLRTFRTARPILAQADRFVVPSGYLVEVFREFGLDAEVVPNIVDLSQFPFRLRRPLRPHLLCTRGFHPYYCMEVVVRAFAEVQRNFPDARLELVGGGPLEHEIRALTSDLNLVNVNFTGVVPHHDIGNCYGRADIFINASRLDNMPVSVIEAFASGTPVVTTAPEGMHYLVEHEKTGLLSDPGDAGGLAGNVIRLLQDQELASRLALNACERAQCYTWPAVREQWLRIYRCMRGQC